MAHKGALRKVNRFITTHDANGKAVFSDVIGEESVFQPLPDDMAFALSYTTQGFPVDMNNDVDLNVYKSFQANPPGLVVSNGTVLRHVDFAPGQTCAMHRTVSLDYGILLEGDIECLLDSGEKRSMKRGDVCIQRGTMHAWRNPSDKEWARMVFVLQACKPLTVAGNALDEDFEEEMEGVKRSS